MVMAPNPHALVIEAAGGVVERRPPRGRLVAIVRRDRYGPEWTLPKGKRNSGESWQDAAVREVREETGIEADIQAPGGCTFYYASGTPKIVAYWHMKVVREPAEFVPNDETKELAWVAPEDAALTLTHPEEVSLVRSMFPEVFHNDSAIAPASGFTMPWLWVRRLNRGGALQRLSTTIAAYEIDLSARAQCSPEMVPGLIVIRRGLSQAKNAVAAAQVEEGWKCLLAVQRAAFLYLPAEVLGAEAIAMRSEATKLNPWRKAAVLKLLDGEGKTLPTSEQLFKAAALRDEHYHNEAYKDALRRRTSLMLAFSLVMVIAALLLIGRSSWSHVDENWKDLPSSFVMLLCVVGLLGAVVSAITDFAQAQGSARIPDMIGTFRVTTLRLFIGPASALALFFAAKTGVGVQVTGGYGMLALAFAAGFSERLVLRVVRSIAATEKGEQ